MRAMTAEAAVKVQHEAKPRPAGKLDLALAMHLAAGRFCSPAGTAFLPQINLAHLTRDQG